MIEKPSDGLEEYIVTRLVYNETKCWKKAFNNEEGMVAGWVIGWGGPRVQVS